MNNRRVTDATLARTAHAALEHLGSHSGLGSWLYTRITDFEQIVIATYDPQFSINANTVMPIDLSRDQLLGDLVKMVVPVHLPNGTTYGALVGLGRDLPAPIAADVEPLVKLLADTLGALAGAEAALAASIRRSERSTAALDTLTGTATRYAWESQLSRNDERCNANAEQAWIVLVSLDETHHFNGRERHEAGDELLDEFGKLLNSTIEGRYLCGRITGMQFGVLAVNISAAEATSLETMLRQTLIACGISAWVGIGRRLPGVGFSAAIDAAEASIAAARSAVNLVAKLNEATAELVDALDRGQILAYFQPIVDMRTGEVVAIEALPRWQTYTGIREPGEFLPAIERAGLSASLFHRMLDDGLRHLSRFHNSCPALRLLVHFDVDSTPMLGLRQTVADLADTHRVPLELISLQLSERQSFDLSPATRDELVGIAKAGVQLVFDDFGVGFASLETMTSLPIGGVKLDRRFTGQVIDGQHEPAVVRAMISMAADAGLEVIAEGVETQTQCDRLVRLGCRLGQGYLFALPLPPDSMATVLSAPLAPVW